MPLSKTRNLRWGKLWRTCLLWLTGWFVGATSAISAPRAAVFSDNLPGLDPVLARETANHAQVAGYETEFIAVETLTNQALLNARRYDLLILPGARSLPATAAPVVEKYLQSGGDVLALGAPAWSSPLLHINGQWISPKTYEQTLASQLPQHMMETFEQADLSLWTKSTSERQPKAHYEVIQTDRGKALHAETGHLDGWETLASPRLEHPFPADHTLTCFHAKGSAGTPQLALEWVEEDGSRWIATINLSNDWKNYALPPEAFQTWESPGRGQNGDHFNPQKAVRFSVGLAMSHTALEGDRHEYWVGELGTAPNPFGDEGPPAPQSFPRLESLSPGYQFFPITSPVNIRPSHEKAAFDDWETKSRALNLSFRSVSPDIFGVHPRPRGIGFNQSRPIRWEPLLGAYDAATKEFRGAVGVLIVHLEPPFLGSVCAVFTPAETSFYRQPLVTNCLQQVLRRMNRGVFLGEGGSEFFTMFPRQSFKVGARVVNFGEVSATNLSVAIDFEEPSEKRQVNVCQAAFDLPVGQSQKVEKDTFLKDDAQRSVVTTLRSGGKVIDVLRHDLGVWKAKEHPEFIQARDGAFWLGGKPWKAHGVNYMPSTGIGVADQHFFEHWLGRGSYDPLVIQRDLERIRAMNLNAVSVFVYYESLQAQNLLDFLRRCEALGLRVNQSLRPGTPLDFRWDEMKELIAFYRLAENDSVFAYDLAWEPGHGNHAQQIQAYQSSWNDWVIKRYGSVTAAEKIWRMDAPRQRLDSPSISVPPMKQLTSDGPWRALVADYRLFLDDLLREKYSAARQLVRSIDPHHAVSFRMSLAGDPTFNWDAALPYDFYGLAGAVDIWEPEAYGRIGDWERVRPGEITAAYGRLCDLKPLIWAEMGYSVWDQNQMAPDQDKLAFEARYYADFYRMMKESGADGVFFWWYPGGFRLNERSDFGIINPDGTDRPVTKIIRNEGARFLKAPKPGKPDYWIAVDRDRDARGLFGISEAAKADFWKAIDQQRRPGFKWERQPGAGTAP